MLENMGVELILANPVKTRAILASWVKVSSCCVRKGSSNYSYIPITNFGLCDHYFFT